MRVRYMSVGRCVSVALSAVLALSVVALAPSAADARMDEVSALTITNTAPVAYDNTFDIVEDGEVFFNPITEAFFSDVEGGTFAFAVVDAPDHGDVAQYDSEQWFYEPTEDWHGTDTFTFKVNDGVSDSNVATVTIIVTSDPDAPEAFDDVATCVEDSYSAINMFSNDYDHDEESFSASITRGPAHGRLTTVTASGAVTYTPDRDWHGTDTFTYKLNDGLLDSKEDAVVRITVTPVADVTSFIKTSGSKTLAKYGYSYTYSGRLVSGETSMAGAYVQLLQCSSQTGTFTAAAEATTTANGGFSFAGIKPASKTWYRVSYAGVTDTWTAAGSAAIYVYPRAYLSNPVAPSTMYLNRAKTVYGTLKPAHSSGSYPVRIYKYRYVSGKWKYYGYVKAKASTITGGSKYSASVKLGYRGKWRLRAYHYDAGHYTSWSSGYDYVTVK